MKIIVGLGNPDKEYNNNRHNVGFMVLDKIQRSETKEQRLGTRWERGFDCEVLKFGDMYLVKPQMYMNNSGMAVRKLLSFYKLDYHDLILIHDDLDIKLGDYKIEMAKGPKQHNGVASVEKELGTKNFLRVRVGVDNRNSEKRTLGEKYVLENFKAEEKIILEEVIARIIAELKEKYAIK